MIIQKGINQCLSCGKEYNCLPARQSDSKFCTMRCYGDSKKKENSRIFAISRNPKDMDITMKAEDLMDRNGNIFPIFREIMHIVNKSEHEICLASIVRHIKKMGISGLNCRVSGALRTLVSAGLVKFMHHPGNYRKVSKWTETEFKHLSISTRKAWIYRCVL